MTIGGIVIGLPEVIAGIMALALNAYVLMGGADFGGGVWDLLARGPRRDAQRKLISDSLAPIWEANHVWLIVVVVVLFTGFPAAFHDLAIVLHIPLTLMLVGIVLRGSAFVFRSYGARNERHERTWGLVFAIASTITPVLLGMMVGALASGAVGQSIRRIGSDPFATVFIHPWLGLFPLVTGLFTLALLAFLAAAYLAYAAHTVELQDDYRRKALTAAAVVFVTAAVSLAVSFREAPRLASTLMTSAVSIPLQVLTGLCAVAAIGALWARKFRMARIAAGAQVSCILWGWVWSHYPYIIPDTLTIREAAAPHVTLQLLLVGLIGGVSLLVPALWYLLRIFDAGGHGAAET